MKNTQLRLPFGRFGNLKAVTLDESFFVPQTGQTVAVGRMPQNDVLFAAGHQWAENRGLVAQALRGLWEFSIQNDYRENPVVEEWEDPRTLEWFTPFVIRCPTGVRGE